MTESICTEARQNQSILPYDAASACVAGSRHCFGPCRTLQHRSTAMSHAMQSDSVGYPLSMRTRHIIATRRLGARKSPGEAEELTQSELLQEMAR